MYSFSRYYKCIPFYGGFVKESSLRYKNKNRYATIKVCEIALNESKYNYLKNYLKTLEYSSNEYLYNIFSAIATPFKKKILIKKAYTCIEFVIDTLSKVCPYIDASEFYSIHDLEQILNHNIVYEGLIKIKYDSSNYSYDHFMDKKNIISVFYYTFTSLYNLAYRRIYKY